ncbi:iron(III) transport system ATP-binding protein [Natranaerovirga hydrolytica]|uniref:ABC-type quaternary amine transporter n=1 Tax=Natranaerovirga hydrolytica TaxID=680378 RepID=A0A4V2Q0D2_9FIRM|nr:ABC transporter ATP-binding protein [Natranaerovirga hydrolytica]TCK92771.1 iron(III) transport system ATP-binding protein [Natranaerovirga hydrolytica]
MMYDIELKSVSKTYIGSDEAAVNNINLTVEKGSIVTLLGPSGSGKSTTLRLIAGFERANSGQITLAGKVVSDQSKWIPPEKRGIGMVFQDYALFPHLNVFDNIGFGYKEKDRKQRIMEVIELVNLKGYEKRYPNELSGGQQQRVALARALTRRPVVVLLDEPFSNLDTDLKNQMRIEVKRIIKEAEATAVFVSHDQKDALSISDKIVVMDEGTIQQIGTPRQIYQYPKNRFVANFVGQSNLLKGRVDTEDNTVETRIGIINCNTIDGGFDNKEEVLVSIRPDSFIMDHKGKLKGNIKELSYTGEAIEVVLEVQTPNNKKHNLLIRVSPDKVIHIGEEIKFNIIPNFVSVIKKE